MVPGKRYTFGDILRIVGRRRWLILIPFTIGIAAIPLIAPQVPKRYRSETLILVVPQRVPDSYVKSTITETIEARLPSISDQILSRSRLERIIADLDLYKAARQRNVMEDVVRRMRDDINVTLAAQSQDSFRVSYVSTDPATARKVTERLAALYIDQNLKDRETQAESTNQFLDAQLQDAKVRLIEHEKKLETYSRAHAGQLPSQLQGNLQAVQNAQLQLQATSEAINRARERRLLIERQIADTQAFPVAGSLQPSGGTDAPPATTEQQLTTAQTALGVLMLKYTPDNPDVQALQRVIADLQDRLKQEASASGEAAPAKRQSAAEVAQQKKILDLKAELEVVDHQLTASQAEEARLKNVIAQYQSKIDAVPSRESELVELTRDYSTLQTAYSTLLMKREDSKLAANLERQQIGEQFRVLDPASLPERPFNQLQRLAIVASAALGGMFIGLLLVAWLELRDTSFREEEDAAAYLKVPVLALIPVMQSERRQRSVRRRKLLADAAGFTVLIVTTALVALWRVRS